MAPSPKASAAARLPIVATTMDEKLQMFQDAEDNEKKQYIVNFSEKPDPEVRKMGVKRFSWYPPGCTTSTTD